MIVCGIEMGTVAVIVGVDEDALWRAMDDLRAPSAMEDTGAAFGVGATRLRVAADQDCTLLARNLGDSVHPSKHAAMVAALRASGVPFVATCHNPYLLDHFAPSEVIVLHDGRADRLSDHHDAKRGMDFLTTGEFYAASGWETP